MKVLIGQGIGPWLVVAPLRVCHLVWPKEAAKWQEFAGMRVEVLHGKDKDAALDRDADVYCVNPEGLEWLSDRLAAMREFKFMGLIVDESTAFKRTNTVRFDLLKPMLGHFSRRYILTGTPAPNGLLDLFGQAYILDMGRSLGRYVTQYRREFFYPTGYGGFEWKPQEGAEERIYEQLAPLMLRMESKEYLKDLPRLVGVAGQPGEIIVEVELDSKARKIYDDLEEHLMADVADNIIVAANAGVASMKCRQVANGGLYLDKTSTAWSKVHDCKTDAVEELLGELNGKPLLVGVDFHHDAERLRKRFGKKTPYIGKGMNVNELKRVESAWNAGDVPILLMSTATPHGLNMQEQGGDVAFHSLTWNLEFYMQFIKRVHRSGVKGLVRVHHVVAADTIDIPIMRALRFKDKVQGAFLRAIKEYARERR